MKRTEVLIIGAGPAGLAAAELLSAYDIEVMIVDEQARPGGQIYRQPPAQFKVANWLASRLYRQGKALLHKVAQLDKLNWRLQCSVLGLLDNRHADADYVHRISLSGEAGLEDVLARSVLVATGCHDMSVIFPGWTLPGVMATGGIQAFVKSQRIVPGARFHFVGSHPLQLVVADQIRQAGGELSGVSFTQPLSTALALLKSAGTVLRHADKFFYIGLTLLRLLQAGVPIRFGETVIEAGGEEALEYVKLAAVDKNGTIDKQASRKVACDRLGVCFSFLASAELPRQRDAACSWSAAGGGWIIDHDAWMCSSVAGLYVAGETSDVAGAEVAMTEGRLAALGIALGLGKLDLQEAKALAIPLRSRLRGLNEFADLLKKLSCPGDRLLEQMMSAESLLCKCEELRVDEFMRILEDNPHLGRANAAKLLSRAGMGLCQGRYCQYHFASLMARHTSQTAGDIGPFNARFPARPVKISALIR